MLGGCTLHASLCRGASLVACNVVSSPARVSQKTVQRTSGMQAADLKGRVVALAPQLKLHEREKPLAVAESPILSFEQIAHG